MIKLARARRELTYVRVPWEAEARNAPLQAALPLVFIASSASRPVSSAI